MIGIVIALAVAIGCGPSTVQIDDATPPPWKVGASTVAITAAPDAGGP
jgi:hypothetical protein